MHPSHVGRRKENETSRKERFVRTVPCLNECAMDGISPPPESSSLGEHGKEKNEEARRGYDFVALRAAISGFGF